MGERKEDWKEQKQSIISYKERKKKQNKTKQWQLEK